MYVFILIAFVHGRAELRQFPELKAIDIRFVSVPALVVLV